MEWLDYLSDHLKPPSHVSESLERMRRTINAPHDVFAMKIMGTGWAIRRTQRMAASEYRDEHPSADEAEVIQVLYTSRAMAAFNAGLAYPPLPKDCDTFDDLCEFMINTESEWAAPDKFGWGERIEAVLFEGESRE